MKVVSIDRRHDNVVVMLEELLQDAIDGEITEFTLIGKKKGGDTFVCATASDNCHTMAGKILDHAILRLGYQPRTEEGDEE